MIVVVVGGGDGGSGGACVLLLVLTLIVVVCFFSIITFVLSNLSNSNVIDAICEEYDSLVYHHFGQSYISQVTTENRILFFPDL